MKKTLLYLEDAGSLRKDTVEDLEDDGYVVKAFGRIDQAKEYLYNHPSEIDCIITDLNMNDEWLEEYRNESDGCLVAGWVWLNRFVYSRSEFLSIPCIIYSGYIKYLEDYLQQKDKLNLLGQYHIYCVPKGGNDDNGYMALSNKLNKIFNCIS